MITFLRVFSSSDSVDSYFILFERAFALLARVSGTPVHFRHHHGFGFSDIVIEVTTLYSGKDLPFLYTNLGTYYNDCSSET